jgi:hypothetical protein
MGDGKNNEQNNDFKKPTGVKAMWGCLRVGARSLKQKEPSVTSRKAPLAIRHFLNWQRQLGALVTDVADLLIDRPDFQLLIWQGRSSAVHFDKRPGGGDRLPTIRSR